MNRTPPFDVFWGEVSPCEHMVQFYADESDFMVMLGRYIGDGLRAGEGVAAIATASHLRTLEARLRAEGLDLDALQARDVYVPLDAATTLGGFIRDGWPDDELFHSVVSGILTRARGPEGRRVRVFGEMVALLWAQGHHGATVRLEFLWNELCKRDRVAVFCAYPRIGSTRDLEISLAEVCALHTQVATADSAGCAGAGAAPHPC